MKILILIPTYNEIENIETLLKRICEVTPSHVEMLVIDDGSPDGTGALVESLAKDQPRIHVLHRKEKMGLGTAYVAGFKWGFANGFDAFVEMDADFSHDPKYLPKMLELLGTHDLVIGSRYVSGGGTVNWGLGRKLLSKFGGIYARTILGAPIRDFTAGFIGIRKLVLDKIDLASLRSDGYSFQIEIKYRAFLKNCKIVEFPIIFEDRKVGHSKMNKRIIIEALRRVWQFKLNSLKNNNNVVSRVITFLCK